MKPIVKTKALHHGSPLRYPGGKAKLSPYFKALIRKNNLLDCTYAEPFAGGGGVGISLLLRGYVNRIVLNDLNRPIYSFWESVLERPDEFIERIQSTPLTTSEWENQRALFRGGEDVDNFDLGFATFYLNRTNVSGVLNGGMIGGYAQSSKYNIDARFNREELIARVRRIARQRSRISIYCMDAAEFIRQFEETCKDSRPLLYIDPPYFKKGRDLYYDYYREGDHAHLRDIIISLPRDVPWVVSYDNVAPIRRLYSTQVALSYNLSYSVKNGRIGREVMFFSHCLEAAALWEGQLQECNLTEEPTESSACVTRSRFKERELDFVSDAESTPNVSSDADGPSCPASASQGQLSSPFEAQQ